MSSYTLLLTACIKPTFNETNFTLKRADPQVRLQDYLQALRFWLHYYEPRIKGIVFVENSGEDLGALKKLAENENRYDRRMEFIQYKADPVPAGLHYGYSELEMIDKAVLQSEILHLTPFMIKVTGRLYFPKLSSLLKHFKEEYKFMSDARDFRLFASEQRYIVTTLFIVSTDFYKKVLLDKKQLMSPSKNFLLENLYFDILKPLYLTSRSQYVLRFPFNVDPVGVGAHADVNYTSFKKKVPSVVRSICRKIFPNFWF